MDKHKLLQLYASELVDRIVRFGIHLDLIEYEFFAGKDYTVSPHKTPLIISSLSEHVKTLLDAGIYLSHQVNANSNEDFCDDLIQKIRHCFNTICELHKSGLGHLPRPIEPIELRRFLRMISKHVIKRDKEDLVVYMTEETTESAYSSDPITILFSKKVKSLVSCIYASPPKVDNAEEASPPGIHIKIPRIDTRNPIRWPSLIHEAAHSLLTSDFLGEEDLADAFRKVQPSEVIEAIDGLKIDLKSWLLEVWCDLLAGLVMGPSFFFSQYHAFLNSPSEDFYTEKYPPNSFRLFMIMNCQQHLYSISKDTRLRALMRQSIELIKLVEPTKPKSNHTINEEATSNKVDPLKAISDAMRVYFLDHFFGGNATDAENFKNKYQKMVRYVNEITVEQLFSMCDYIKLGQPVPSKTSKSGIWFEEEPTSIQEVLLAAWISRSNGLLPAQSKECNRHLPVDIKLKALKDLSSSFDRAVLRSLQIAEWLHALIDPSHTSSSTNFTSQLENGLSKHKQKHSMICDLGIAQLLKNRNLKVVPLVNLEQQLGAASLDIRLGTSFEVYQPAYVRDGARLSYEGFSYISKVLDLDFLNSLSLLPGQMILAHSFEFIHLPDDVAAELEGRSSYARLGLEIHLTAGMIDPGFQGTITFEMVNNGPEPILLMPGLRIGQLRFHRLDKPMRPYSKRRGAKYGQKLAQGKSLHMEDPDYEQLKKLLDTREH